MGIAWRRRSEGGLIWPGYAPPRGTGEPIVEIRRGSVEEVARGKTGWLIEWGPGVVSEVGFSEDESFHSIADAKKAVERRLGL